MTKPTFQTSPLSGSTNYLPINITAITSGTAITIHTASATDTDELWLDAYNYGNTDGYLYLMLGGASAHQIVSVPVPSQRGFYPLLKGQRVTGSIIVKAYASQANIISVIGNVNKIVFV